MGIPRGRGREPGFRMSADHRLKITNSNILNCLIEHAEGGREMSGTQVTAAIALLKKVMPDLAAVQHSGEDSGPMTVTFVTVLEKGPIGSSRGKDQP
jgi:hypothetical protein